MPTVRSISLVGRISVDADRAALAAGGRQVTLLNLHTWESTRGFVAEDGSFAFNELEPGTPYFLAAWHHARSIQDANSAPEQTRMSWHLTLEAPGPGTYGMYLGKENADSAYLADVLWRAWKQAQLHPL
jgi:hypothetical protein